MKKKASWRPNQRDPVAHRFVSKPMSKSSTVEHAAAKPDSCGRKAASTTRVIAGTDRIGLWQDCLEGTNFINCPKYASLMVKVNFDGLGVDNCSGCHGTFFDE